MTKKVTTHTTTSTANAGAASTVKKTQKINKTTKAKPRKIAKTSLPVIPTGKLGNTRFKPGKTLEGREVKISEPVKMSYREPKIETREIPRPGRDSAMAISKSVLEHVYWLGNAVKNGDKEAGQREVDAIARFSTLYFNFAKNPDNQPLKFSTADNYPENAKKYKKKSEYPDEAGAETEADNN